VPTQTATVMQQQSKSTGCGKSSINSLVAKGGNNQLAATMQGNS